MLGPLLYVLYIAELEPIVMRHSLHLHMYADDCQVYLSMSVDDVPLAVSKFAACVADISAMAEFVQTSAERGEDTADMARLESAVGQGQLS